MTKIFATYDGEVLRPEEPLELSPNTRVCILLEPAELEPQEEKDYLFLRTVRSLNLDGPPDWSSRWEEYTYGDAESEVEPE